VNLFSPLIDRGSTPLHKDSLVSERPDVVVVDGLRETTEVLQAVFEPRGLRICRQSTAAALTRSATNRPQILVLHENPPADPAGPRVLVGRIVPGSTSHETQCTSLPLPFDYGDLIAAIDAAVEAPAR
jgi:hypothetical protein